MGGAVAVNPPTRVTNKSANPVDREIQSVSLERSACLHLLYTGDPALVSLRF
jgi:hypothetical protein